MAWVGITFGLILGNFIYQSFVEHNWGDAVERSVFQLAAILAIYYVKPWEL